MSVVAAKKTESEQRSELAEEQRRGLLASHSQGVFVY